MGATADFYQWHDIWKIDPADSPCSGEIRLMVKDFPDSRGMVYISLFSSRDAIAGLFSPFNQYPTVFSEKPGFNEVIDCARVVLQRQIEEQPMIIVLPNIPYGDYAISVFQDVNRNQQLDLDDTGIPYEPWGLTNNPPRKYRPPNFTQARFRLESKVLYQVIEMQSPRPGWH